VSEKAFIFVLILIGGRSEPEVAEWVQVLKLRYAGMKIAVGRDKLDEIQVIRNSLPHKRC
jgi:trehalose-6-phosphate synthase